MSSASLTKSLTPEELENLQDVMCDKPPKYEHSYEDCCMVSNIYKNPSFQAWADEMMKKYTRQYLMTNFLQYAWRNDETYKDYPILWTKPIKKTQHPKDPLTQIKNPVAEMKILDKDAPDTVYLAVFFKYQIPIYGFHIHPTKRVYVGAKKQSSKKMLCDRKAVEALKAELATLKAQASAPKVSVEPTLHMAMEGLSEEALAWMEKLPREKQDNYQVVWEGFAEDALMRRVSKWCAIVEMDFKKTLKK